MAIARGIAPVRPPRTLVAVTVLAVVLRAAGVVATLSGVDVDYRVLPRGDPFRGGYPDGPLYAVRWWLFTGPVVLIAISLLVVGFASRRRMR